MRVSQEVMSVLDRATCDGNALSLTALGQLDRKLYTDTNKALEAAGGKWNRKAKAHLFEGLASDAIEPIILTGEVVSIRQELQQFYTPAELAERVIAEANLSPGLRVLEPSAGRGALAAPAFLAQCLIHCVEIDERSVHILASTAFEQVVHGDFLATEPTGPAYDRVVMNPPFTRDQDIKHDESSMVIARVSSPDDFPCRDQDQDEAFAAECEANGHVLAAAPEMLVQLKGLLGFARFVISAVDIDVDQTKVVLRNKGEFVAEVPVALLLEHSEAAVAKAEGRS